MNITYKLLALCLSVTFLVGCSEDDDSRQFTNNNSNGTNNSATTLTGFWDLHEFPGDDGNTYGLNQFIPFYDSTVVPGCAVFDKQVMFLEYRYSFQNDSLASLYRSYADQTRSYSVVNSSTCEFSYGPWATDNSSNSGNFKYEKISATTLVFKYDGTTNNDTLTFSIFDNVLTLSDGNKTLKLKK